MPTIVSSTRLRNEYNAISDECHATGRPIFVTRNGSGDLAVMSMEAYDRLISNVAEELGALLAVGHADVESGNTRPATDVIAGLRAKLSV